MKDLLVDVVFPLPISQAFTYKVPSELMEMAQVGCRVIAPFGQRKLTGFIVSFKDHSDRELKELGDALDLEPVFSQEVLKLAQWISDYYLCSLGEALRVTLPSALMQRSRKYIQPASDRIDAIAEDLEEKAPRQAQILRYLRKSGRISLETLKRRIGAKSLESSINQLQTNGWVHVEQLLQGGEAKPKFEKYVRLLSNGNALEEQLRKLEKTAPRQADCLHYLEMNGKETQLREVLQKGRAPLTSVRSLERKGLVRIFGKEVAREYYEVDPDNIPPEIQLNHEQQVALDRIEQAISNRTFETFLLFGVTGSGKTQVYIEAIYKVLEQGRDAIVLVPEIALTPQTVQRFRAHFKGHVAVLHSAMSQGERFDSWRMLKSGKAKVAIGPRSAVFAPLKNVGLIVVDEEHESAYKQAESPRYNARDVAVVRAMHANAAVILGSATPSAESYYNAKIGKYQLLQLLNRVDDAPLPEVNILDLSKEKRLSGKKEEPILSRLLAKKIHEKIARQEQIILLLNRRGFSSYIRCKACGFIENCGNCQITLTYHLSGRRLRCHYCGFTKRSPSSCPECGGPDIVFRGPGTQKVEEELGVVFPEARVVRMDLDTTGRKQAHDRILKDFEVGKYDILLGTQMVAKGLDFRKVTLVGVINADTALLLPDFRSSERTFQLLTQVAGRAGRKDLAGEVIIQTYWPDSFCLHCAKQHDFVRFFEGEILERRQLLYPPFGRIITILFRGEKESGVVEAARNYARVIKSQVGPFQILGPIQSPIAKIQKKFRGQILLKGDREKDPAGKILRRAVANAEQSFNETYKAHGVHISVDVDPLSLI